ncbi:MAG: endonuclease domain-containing protein [Burkholderiales bacterium]|nr:endonuclease domain-containing protein [Burkholderiales bacterium]
MKGQTNPAILGQKLPQRLRRDMTDAERKLWRALRQKQAGGHKFRRQHPFGDYIVDFVCLESMLVVEVDGGQHAELEQRDTARTAVLAKAGFRVLRFWNHEVLRDTDAVLEAIWRALEEGTPSPPSDPSP